MLDCLAEPTFTRLDLSAPSDLDSQLHSTGCRCSKATGITFFQLLSRDSYKGLKRGLMDSMNPQERMTNFVQLGSSACGRKLWTGCVASR